MLREITVWCGVLVLFVALLIVTVSFVLALIVEVDHDFIDPPTDEVSSKGQATEQSHVSP